jgi:hypothetical protein
MGSTTLSPLSLTLLVQVDKSGMRVYNQAFLKRFYLKEDIEVEISENLMTTKLNVSIHFLFNGRDLIRNIKCTVYFT